MAKKIFLIAGEASGDALGAKLIEALRKRAPGPIEFMGIGGPQMEAAGLKSLLPMDELSVMGLWEVLAHLPRLMKLINGIVQEIEKRKPDAVITIDLPDLNFRIASRLKAGGKSKAKLIHYVAPTVWAWRPGRAKMITEFLDGLMCLYPFEPQYFPGLKTRFVGHPLIETNLAGGDGTAFRERYEIPQDVKTLGLFFGSRISEVKAMGNILKDVASFVKEIYPDVQLIVPTLPHLEFNVLKILESADCPATLIKTMANREDAFAACDAAVAVSGTVGLELAYAGIPHVIVYKTHPVTWMMLKAMVKVKYAHLANIMLDEPVFPEFLQGKAKAIAVSKAIMLIYRNPDLRLQLKEKSEKLRLLLGADNALPPSARAADFVLSFLRK